MNVYVYVWGMCSSSAVSVSSTAPRDLCSTNAERKRLDLLWEYFGKN